MIIACSGSMTNGGEGGRPFPGSRPPFPATTSRFPAEAIPRANNPGNALVGHMVIGTVLYNLAARGGGLWRFPPPAGLAVSLDLHLSRWLSDEP